MIGNDVMLTDEFENDIFYTVACHCGAKECSLELELEHDTKINDITLRIYTDLQWRAYWGTNNIFQEFWKRITGACRMFFTGKIKVYDELLIQNQEHMQSFIDALKEGKQKLETNNQTKKETD
jgi:hypothetical protein